MKRSAIWIGFLAALLGSISLATHGSEGANDAKPADAGAAAAGAADSEALVPLKLDLPKPLMVTTPRNVKVPHCEALSIGTRPPLMVPKGCVNLALKKPVTSSDKDPVIGSLDVVTDGDKDVAEGSFVELARGSQWVQIDLGAEHPLHAIVVWHYHGDKRVYQSVIVQACNDKDFIQGVTTLFNNDFDNSVGLGAGTDLNYWETHEGKLIAAKGVKARYVRLYSNGNTSNDNNHYTEVEVWGLPK